MVNKKAIIFLFFLIIFLFTYFFVDKNIDAYYLKNAFRFGHIEGFRFPLLFFVTMPFYYLFQEQAFTILPLLLYFSSLAFLIKMFDEFELNFFWLIPFFLIVLFSVSFIAFFVRDSLNFFLATIFAYFFLKAYYKKQNHFLLLTLIVFLMLYANPQAILFFVLLLVLGFAHYKGVLFSLLMIDKTEVFSVWQKAIELVLNFRVKDLWFFLLPFNNYFNILTFVCLLANKEKLFIIIFAMELFLGGIAGMNIYPDPNPEQLVYRYGFMLMPLQIFFVAKTLKKLKIMEE